MRCPVAVEAPHPDAPQAPVRPVEPAVAVDDAEATPAGRLEVPEGLPAGVLLASRAPRQGVAIEVQSAVTGPVGEAPDGKTPVKIVETEVDEETPPVVAPPEGGPQDV